MHIDIYNPETCEALRTYADDCGVTYSEAAEEILHWYLFKAGDQIFELEKLNRKQGA